jgi:type 1 fimbriae regulatory protein FimE
MEVARKRGRHGHRDATMILIAFRHGLRPAEVCALRWDMIDLGHGLLHVRRVKNGTPSVQPLGGIELRALRKLKREEVESRFAFMTERLAPVTVAGFRKMIARIGETAEFPFPVHPHMLRHACGYKLANDGQDTRAVQHYLGHKNIQHTVRYTELSSERLRLHSLIDISGYACLRDLFHDLEQLGFLPFLVSEIHGNRSVSFTLVNKHSVEGIELVHCDDAVSNR